jgi:uncharacterized protein with PQ loop repeat
LELVQADEPDDPYVCVTPIRMRCDSNFLSLNHFRGPFRVSALLSFVRYCSQLLNRLNGVHHHFYQFFCLLLCSMTQMSQIYKTKHLVRVSLQFRRSVHIETFLKGIAAYLIYSPQRKTKSEILEGEVLLRATREELSSCLYHILKFRNRASVCIFPRNARGY